MNRGVLIDWFTVGPWFLPLPLTSHTLRVEVYGLLVWLSLVVGVLVAVAFARTHQRSSRSILSLAAYLIAFSFPISAVLNAVFYQPAAFFEALQQPSSLARFPFGLSSYGGVIGAITGGLVWRHRSGESLLRVGDAAAFAGPFGWSVARLGCFLSHDHPGTRTDFFLGVADFPTGPEPYTARHDLGLYEMLAFATVAAVLAWFARQPQRDGFYVALLPMLYAPIRFTLDFLRAPLSEGGDIRYGGLTPGQYASIAAFIVGVALMHRIRQPTNA